MLKYLKKIIYFILIFYLLAVVWGRFFNPIITWTQLGGLFQYQKLDREYVSYDEMGDYVKIAVIASEDQLLREPWRIMKKENESKAEARFPSRRPKIFFFGIIEAGLEKA